MRTLREGVLTCCLPVLLLGTMSLRAGATEQPAKLRVGISPFVPFVISDQGDPRGFSVELWQELAQELGVEYEFVESAGVADKLQALRDGKLDVAIGGISVTKAREEVFDFTHPVFHTGLDILVRPGRGLGLLDKLLAMLTRSRLTILAGFLLLVVVAGHIIWFLERGEGSLFGKKYSDGILEGSYWAVVTASTVGYGDRVPRKRIGKLLAILVIIISLPMFALFVAELSSALTMQRLHTGVGGSDDLPGRKVAVVRGTTSAEYVETLRASVRPFGQIADAYQALLDGAVEAVVYDAPALQYYAQTEGRGKVALVGKLFMPQDFALAVPQGSRLREQLNRAILALVARREINRIHVKWFGEEKR